MGLALKERGAPMGQRVFSKTGTCLRFSPLWGQPCRREAFAPAPAIMAVSEHKGQGSPGRRLPPKSFWAAQLRKTTFRSRLVTTTGSEKSIRSGPRNSTGTGAPSTPGSGVRRGGDGLLISWTFLISDWTQERGRPPPFFHLKAPTERWRIPPGPQRYFPKSLAPRPARAGE